MDTLIKTFPGNSTNQLIYVSFLLGFFYKNVLKLELTSLQRLLVILCSIDILKFSSKSVAHGVAGHFSPSFISGKHSLNTYSVFSSVLGPGTNA